MAHAGIIFVNQTGRKIGNIVKLVDAHLENREDEDRGIKYL